MEGTDICFAPVLTMTEASRASAPRHATLMSTSRASRSSVAAPRSRTKEGVKGPAARRGEHTDQVLGERGFSTKEIGELKAAGIVGAQ
jgi:alpha-methylacyl-CoA racemase